MLSGKKFVRYYKAMDDFSDGSGGFAGGGGGAGGGSSAPAPVSRRKKASKSQSKTAKTGVKRRPKKKVQE